MHKILLVDDHQLVLDGLQSIFANDPELEVVGTVNNGVDALRYLQNLEIDLVLTDIDMPQMNGVELTREIRKRSLPQKVIVLTMHNEKSLIKEIIEIGANGYLLKTAGQEEMVQAVKNVLAGQKSFSTDVTLSLLSDDAPATSGEYDLTDREVEILQLIAEGFSNKEIGEKLFISHRTVDTHRTNMMKKLEVKNIAGLIRFAIQHNIIQ